MTKKVFTFRYDWFKISLLYITNSQNKRRKND